MSNQDKSQRPASVEAYYAVMALRDAGTISVDCWKTYEALWHKGPLSLKSILALLKTSFPSESKRTPWSGCLKKLLASGLIAAAPGGDLDTTDAKEIQSAAPAKKPSAKRFKKGVEDLEMALFNAERRGFVSAEAGLVVAWLKGKT